MASAFIHLHVHSHYSLLDGLPKIKELVAYAKELGMDAIAITDHGVLYGAVEFYKEAKKAGVKAIIGMEGYVASGSMHEKTPGIDDKRYHITLLAKNNKGYQNLIELTTKAHLEGFYYKPRIDKELLRKHSEGLIALSGCLTGEVAKNILSGNVKKAKEAALEYQAIFGKENFFFEVQQHANMPEQTKVNEVLYQMSGELKIPVVATQDTHYLRKDDAEAQDVLMGINTGHALDEAGRLTMKDDDFSLRSPEEMASLFQDHPEVIAATRAIADSCNVEIELGKYHLPYFTVPDGFDENSYLEQLAVSGLALRYPHLFNDKDIKANTIAGLQKKYPESASEQNKILERLNYELSVVRKMGFSSYFLIVQDLVNWAKKNNIVVGPGRGSAAGSLASYLLNITNVDPLQYRLLFERFLQVDRNQMPDIDLDFADTRRDEVIKYVAQKYGQEHVAQIITFGTMASRAVVRDVGRVLGYAYGYCDTVAKMIPMSYSLEKALSEVEELKNIYARDPQAKRLLDLGQKLEGVARHASTHACGVVITKESMHDRVPRQNPSQEPDLVITQYEMHAIEDLGLLKIDLLGLKNLTIIENVLSQIEALRHEQFDLDKIPLDDPATFTLLQQTNTTGVFQLESDGMRRHLRELRPTNLEDIIAMVALYRPGPMQFIPDFMDRKHGRKTITYLHPKLEPILKNTYGIAVYQEQVLEVAREIAGFSYSEADVLRKAIGKKIKELLEEQKGKFIKGAVANNVPQSIAEQLFHFIEPFASYGFNRAHATCYGLIAYQTAYLKAHFPLEFMAALLNADQKHIERISFLIDECGRMGITVLPPAINESGGGFAVVTADGGTPHEVVVNENGDSQKTIRFGLAAIKNVGTNVVETIIKERKTHGPYTSIENLMSRVAGQDFNKKSLESLIKSGALDAYGERNTLLYNMDMLLQYGREKQRAAEVGQESLFGDSKIAADIKVTLSPVAPAPSREKLTWEKELLGLYITGHPLLEYKEKLAKYAAITNAVKTGGFGSVVVAGVIQNVKKIVTRNGKPMAFVTLEDLTGRLEALVFPNLYAEQSAVLLEGKIIVAAGKINERDGTAKLLCDTIKEL